MVPSKTSAAVILTVILVFIALLVTAGHASPETWNWHISDVSSDETGTTTEEEPDDDRSTTGLPERINAEGCPDDDTKCHELCSSRGSGYRGVCTGDGVECRCSQIGGRFWHGKEYKPPPPKSCYMCG